MPCLNSSSDAALLRRTAPVVRDRRHVDDVGDLVAHVVQRTHGRLTTRTRALDADFQRLHAVVERSTAGLFGGDLGSDNVNDSSLNTHVATETSVENHTDASVDDHSFTSAVGSGNSTDFASHNDVASHNDTDVASHNATDFDTF